MSLGVGRSRSRTPVVLTIFFGVPSKVRLGFWSLAVSLVYWPKALTKRRRASARSRPPVKDSPLTAPLSNSGGFPVKLGLVLGARLSVWGIGPQGPVGKA